MSRFRQSLGYRIEQIYPCVLGLGVGLSFLIYAPKIDTWGQASHIHLENTYTAASGLFAIIAGFLASFYGSIQALADTRLQRLASVKVFQLFLQRIKQSTIVGFALAVISIPLMVFNPTDFGESFFWRALVAVWVGAAIYGVALFVRVGRLLFFVFEIRATPDVGAG